ncbi:amino acid adenylation domain-containing protein [Actinoplanes sp. NPDC049681]|uniref:amino acid adenylation domain-containing protein n=1 Tax=Actinoplanes sp. NPDC049681 TaxID=3363905 RepID=UPI0037939C12
MDRIDTLTVAAEVLGREVTTADAARLSFTALGGTSLRAIECAARIELRHGLTVPVPALLGPEPLAGVLDAAVPATPAPAVAPSSGLRPASRVQQAMLVGEQLHGGTPFHLLFSADLRGRVDPERLGSVLGALTRRHASLRTVFVQDGDGLARRVLPRWTPVVLDLPVPPDGCDPVAAVQAILAPAAGRLLDPFRRPPVVFAVTPAGPSRIVLSLLVHHALVDGWSVGLLFRELVAGLGGADLTTTAPALEAVVAAERTGAVAERARQRAEALAGTPTTLELPTDAPRPGHAGRTGTRLLFGLSDAARDACTALARGCGTTRNTVLLAAWSLVVARRTAVPEFVMGVVAAGRTAATLDVVGPCLTMVPVVCQIDDAGTVADHVRRTAAGLRTALAATDVPLEDIVAALELGGDDARHPLVQVAFAAHDELVPEELGAFGVTATVHEGHCGGTVYDAVLYVQRWADRPRLALEYATDVLRPDEAAELACALNQALEEMAAGAPLAEVRTMTPAQRQRLAKLGAGPDVAGPAGIWHLFEAAVAAGPDRIAVRDGDPARTLTYAELRNAAERQSAELAAAGVRAGDCVALAVRRSAREIVAVLAVLRLGAAYAGIEADVPASTAAGMRKAAGARIVLGDDDRADLRIIDPWDGTACRGDIPEAAGQDPERVAYIAFTSGSTGVPKGARVPHRGVVRLTRDADFLVPGATDRFVRLAPLAFDASTLEIFAPLLAGGTVDVFPDGYPTPAALATFLSERRTTGLWLTAGLFRLVADYQPHAFAGLRQILTGGDVVPPAQVARVLAACPGLRVTNGYGPTENTTFTTTHAVDDPAEVSDPLPIGRPVAGTGVAVLDQHGRPVPPGGIGELHTSGAGLALGYAGRPAETAAAFGQFAASGGERLYRTGDLARWDGEGRLRFLGRRDRQVKIRGFRIELEAVARVLRDHAAVRDVAVVATPGEADRRLLAGLVADDRPGLVAEVRRFAADRLPGYAVPSLWAVVRDLPVTRNGKLDAARLRDLAQSPGPAGVPSAAVLPEGDDVTATIARTWADVLGTARFGLDERFFEVGGDSLQLLRVAATLRQKLPHHDVTVQDLFACQTIRALSGRLLARSPR